MLREFLQGLGSSGGLSADATPGAAAAAPAPAAPPPPPPPPDAIAAADAPAAGEAAGNLTSTALASAPAVASDGGSPAAFNSVEDASGAVPSSTTATVSAGANDDSTTATASPGRRRPGSGEANSVRSSLESGSAVCGGAGDARPGVMELPRALLVRSFVSDMERGAAYQSLPIPQPYPLEAPPISSATSSEDASRPKAQKGKQGRLLRLEEMRVPHVLSCLNRLGLGRHAPAFERHQVDGPFLDLMDEDLLHHQLGVSAPDERSRFLQWLSKMRRDAPGN